MDSCSEGLMPMKWMMTGGIWNEDLLFMNLVMTGGTLLVTQSEGLDFAVASEIQHKPVCCDMQ